MQQLSNFHSHCDFCDGRAPMERFVQYAIKKNLSSFGVSSHAPVPFETRWAMKQDDMDDYIQEFIRLKLKYAKEISLYVGLEMDYFPNEKTWVFDTFKDLALDYRIGSIHFIDDFPDGTRWIIDGNAHAFKVATEQIYGNDVKKAVKRYFEISEEMVHNASFDIIGHMDKIVPNATQFGEFDMQANWYKELMMSILTSIKEKGIIIEINTKSLLSRGMTFPNQEYYKQIHAMNIPIMVNSDCHYPDMIIASFEETYAMLKETGFRTVRTMVEGKWVEVSI